MTLPIYNKPPLSNRLSLCILELNGFQVQKINSYTLAQQMYLAVEQAVGKLEERSEKSVYERFDALDSSEINAAVFDAGLSDILQSE